MRIWTAALHANILLMKRKHASWSMPALHIAVHTLICFQKWNFFVLWCHFIYPWLVKYLTWIFLFESLSDTCNINWLPRKWIRYPGPIQGVRGFILDCITTFCGRRVYGIQSGVNPYTPWITDCTPAMSVDGLHFHLYNMFVFLSSKVYNTIKDFFYVWNFMLNYMYMVWCILI